MMLVMHDQGNMNDFYKIVLTTTNGGYGGMLCSINVWSPMRVMTIEN